MFSLILCGYKWARFLLWCTWNASNLEMYSASFVTELQRLGKIGTKIGQYICNRPGFCSIRMKQDLSVFLNHNQVHPISHTIQILRNAGLEQHVTLGEIIGSGTFAQVYMCTLDTDTRPLVLKVNHPVNDFVYDLYILRYILWFASWMFRMISNVDWNEWMDSIHSQLDMKHEMENMKLYHDIYKNYPTIRVPECIVGTSDLIIMTYEEGHTLNMIPRNDKRYKKAHCLVMSSFIHTGFVYNIMHGDVHEGNVLVRNDGGITLLDFGICINLSMPRLTYLLSIPNPSPQDMDTLLSVLIHPSSFDRTKLCSELCIYYTNLFSGDTAPRFSDIFNVITTVVERHKFMIRGNLITYMMNIMLLEDLSPYKTSYDQISSMRAMLYMKKDPFFQKECGDLIDVYLMTLMNKLC